MVNSRGTQGLLACKRPPVVACTDVQVRLRHVEEIESAFAQQQPQVQRTWFGSRRTCGIERIEARRLEPQLAGSAKVSLREFDVGSHEFSGNVMESHLVTRPT